MKKIFISIIAALLSLVFSGCSCSEAAILSFDNLWGGAAISYKESLVYSVAYKSDYAEFDYSFVKSAELSGLTIEISGTYTVDNEILSKENPSIPQTVKDNEIFKIESPSVVKSTTKLDLTASYSLSDKTETSVDHIYTTAYYYNNDYSFAPIYVERELSYSYPYFSDGQIHLAKLEGNDVTEYATGKYTVGIKYGKAEEFTKTEYEYGYKTLIDNSALFMALRNKKVAKDESYSVPVVHPSYGKESTLNVKHFADTEKEITFTLNGEEKAVSFAVQGVSFVVNSVKSSGTPQVVFVQNGESGGINKSLVVNYIEPLVEYGFNNKIGALVYTLTSANYS